MGWAIGYDSAWKRDIGYGVPAMCDHPDCDQVIDRGLSYVCCDTQLYGGDNGCGLYFCSQHTNGIGQCARCQEGKPSFKPSDDLLEWKAWKLADTSWEQWRQENPDEVVQLQGTMP